jgi:hypothetical protein
MYPYGKAAQPRQDGAGFASIKLDVEPGERILVVRSNNAQPIQDVFAQINDRIMKKWLPILNMQMMYQHKKANILILELF